MDFEGDMGEGEKGFGGGGEVRLGGGVWAIGLGAG